MGNQEKDQELELLKFNYQNLHNAVWEAHKAAWTVIGIFIPVIFALQGYLAKAYVFSDERSIGKLAVCVLILELLLLFWRLVLWMFEYYNHQRLNKLRAIEEVFEGKFSKQGKEKGECELVRQYKGFRYKHKIPLVEFGVSWNGIYTAVVILITLLNLAFIAYIWRDGKDMFLTVVSLVILVTISLVILVMVVRMLIAAVRFVIRKIRLWKGKQVAVRQLSQVFKKSLGKTENRRGKVKRKLGKMKEEHEQMLEGLENEVNRLRDRFEGLFLFSAELKYKTDLDNGRVPDAFRENIPLSQNVEVTVEKEGSSWLLIDKGNDRKYFAEGEAGKLNVHNEEWKDSIILASVQRRAREVSRIGEEVRRIVKEFDHLELEVQRLKKASEKPVEDSTV